MGKAIRTIFMFALMALAPSSLLLAQSEDITLKSRDGARTGGRTPVEFPHGLHMGGELSCTDCHHDYRRGRNVLDESSLKSENHEKIRCASCHAGRGHNDYDIDDAFHLKCMGCHRKAYEMGKKTGPRLCAQCHPRAE